MNIVIYSKKNCPNCIKTKSRLDKYNPKILILDKDISRYDFFEKFPNVKQVPQVMIDNKHIGGYEDVEKWLAFNKPNEDF
tara:strand:- start:56 stop:295 length:240 start_codon:yes stop_codon:yes gene_type:complete